MPALRTASHTWSRRLAHSQSSHRRLAWYLGTLVGFAMISACNRAGADTTLSDATLKLEFSPTDGHLVGLTNGAGRKLAGVVTDSVGLWSLDLAPADSARAVNKSTDYMAGSTSAGAAQEVYASQAKQFSMRHVDARTLELVWDKFDGAAAPNLMVTATVQLRTDSSASWHIKIDGLKDVAVDHVHYPRISGISFTGPGLELATPVWMGQRARDPQRILQRADSAKKPLEYVYPGALSMQALALSSAKEGGLYFAADDTLAYRKSFAFWREADGTA
ncbi:MAG: hypothetical protein ABI120_07220 [Gemmatimonadaceae bacterium]